MSESRKRASKGSTSSVPLVAPPPPSSLSPPPPPSAAPAVLPARALWRWSHALEASAVFALALALLARTAYPSVSGGDAGELIVTACNLGVAHPPGYPTFTMWSAMFVRLLDGIGSPAWRVNMATATLTAVSAAALYWCARLLTNSRAASFAASLGFLCSPTVWTYAGQGEVFGLNNALHALLCAVTAAFGATRSTALAGCAALLCGLLATNQHTSIFTSVPTALGVLLHGGPRRLLAPRRLLPIVGAALLGLAPYAYLPWSSSRAAPDSWGETASFAGFARHFLRQEYGTFQLAADVNDTVGLWGRLRVYAAHLMSESLYVTVPLALLGLVAACASGSGKSAAAARRSLLPYVPLLDDAKTAPANAASATAEGGSSSATNSEATTIAASSPLSSVAAATASAATATASAATAAPLSPAAMLAIQQRMLRFCAVVFALCYSTYVLMFHYLANLDLTPLFLGVQARFWQQANLYVFLFGAVGFDALRVAAVRAVSPRSASGSASASSASSTSSVSASAVRLVFGVAALAFVGAQIALNWELNDHSSHMAIANYGRTILSAMPPNALILINGDINNNAVKYMHQCEGLRRDDVSVLSLQLASWEWFVPTQRRNYPRVRFPKNKWRYHPRKADGFSIAQLLDKNYKHAPIFLCGPWKEGDESWRAGYTTAVFGLCDRVLTLADFNALDWAAHIRAARAAVPSTRQLGNWSESVFAADTWERVVFHDSWHRFLHHASLAAYHASQASAKQIEDRALFKIAAAFYDEMFAPDQPTITPIPVGEYRSAGVIYGTLSKLTKKADRQAELSDKMFAAWRRFVELTPDDKEIAPIVRDRYNPYLGRVMK